MKKIFFPLLGLFFSCMLMIYFVGNLVEKEIKTVFSENMQTGFSINLVSYQRDFLTATAISEIQFSVDQGPPLSYQVITTIQHYPYQASLNNAFEITDEVMAKKVELYFGTSQWITSTASINLFSQLTGQLLVVAGKYESESEALSNEPLQIDYQVDIKNKNVDFNLYWAGVTGRSYATVMSLKSLQFTSYLDELSKESNYDYQLTINSIEMQEGNNHSLLEKIELRGSSQQGLQQKTIDTTNEIIVGSYKINSGKTQTFTDNRLKLILTGLHQPALELLNAGSDDNEEIEHALIKLVDHGAQLTLSQMNSQTPWGEVDGTLDLVLDKGASLTDILINPYTLFDYMSGDVSLVLPVGLLDEPRVAESLQIGIMAGFLEKNEETLNLQTSFQQGELIVNGRVIPL